MSEVETYDGARPPCKWCGKLIPPKYKTKGETERVRRPLKPSDITHHLGHSSRPFTNGYELNLDVRDPDNTDAQEVVPAEWDKEKRHWYITTTVRRIKSRKFTGEFNGVGGNPKWPLFCSRSCGFKYGESAASA